MKDDESDKKVKTPGPPAESLARPQTALERVLAQSARIVSGVADSGQTLDAMLAAHPGGGAAVRAVATGAVRWYLRLNPIVDALASARLDRELRSLLVCALHQIEYSRTPAPTVVNAAVSAAQHLGLARAGGLVNAVLRRFLREREALEQSPAASVAARRTAHPGWLVERLTADWGEARALEILEANNAAPPMTLRVNRSRISVADLHARLEASGIVSSAVEWAPCALILDRARNVQQIPGFEEGLWSVQDAGAQLAADILDADAGMRVLDACAAPGGKASHILERSRGVQLIANDFGGGRLARVEENLRRLGLSAELLCLDARKPDGFAPGSFDRVLTDVPCSGTGVIRRHPDIKLLRRASDITPMAAIERKILEAGFRWLKPGGRLVYATCSALTEENEALLTAFLDVRADAVALPISDSVSLPPDALQLPIGIQLLPGSRSDTDGFYYACIEKTTGH